MSNSPEAAPRGGDTAVNLKQYDDASVGSAGRARFVLIVMVTASVLSLLAMWNSRAGNMTQARLAVATNAQKFYDPADESGRRFLPDEKVRPLFANEEEFKTAKEFFKQQRGRFADLDHLKHYIDFLERTRVERIVNVSIPFFGSAFDINDLGMFAGVSFFIILLLFRFSLFRELRNVRLVFKQAKTVEQLELCYNMLAMQQVLTSPPPLDMMPPDGAGRLTGLELRGLFWDNVSKVLFALPMFAHVMIFLNDWGTYDVRNVYPSIGISLWVSGVFLLLNMLLTLVCLSLGFKLDRTWRNHAHFILRHRAITPVDLAEDEDGEERAEPEKAFESLPAGAAAETTTTRRETNKG